MSPLNMPPNSWARVQLEERYRSNATMAVTFEQFFGAAPQLAEVMEITAAPWLATALEELRDLKEAGRDLPGLGDFRITDDTVDCARRLLTLESIRKLAAPTIVPFSGGGLSLTWSAKGRDLSLSIYPDHEITYARTSQNDELVEDGSVAEDLELAKIANRFLASLV